MNRLDEAKGAEALTIVDKTVLDDGNCFSVRASLGDGVYRVFGDVKESTLLKWLGRKMVRLTNASVVVRGRKRFVRLRGSVPTKRVKGVSVDKYRVPAVAQKGEGR